VQILHALLGFLHGIDTTFTRISYTDVVQCRHRCILLVDRKGKAMYQIEKRLKVTSWRTRITLKTDGTHRRSFDAEIMVCTTGHHLYLTTYDVEGITGAFVKHGIPGVDPVTRLVKIDAQARLVEETKEWRKRYGQATG